MCIYKYLHTCICIYGYVHTHHVHVDILVETDHIYVCVYIHIYVHIYTSYVHINTYIRDCVDKPSKQLEH